MTLDRFSNSSSHDPTPNGEGSDLLSAGHRWALFSIMQEWAPTRLCKTWSDVGQQVPSMSEEDPRKRFRALVTQKGVIPKDRSVLIERIVQALRRNFDEFEG